MKSLLVASLLSVVYAFVPSSFRASASTPAAPFLGRCEYYEELSRSLSCPAGGYLVNFGARYCRKFERDMSRFSRAGADAVGEIRLCLQQRLESTAGLSCALAGEVGPASHIDCYVEHGFCEMNFWDQVALTSIVWPALLGIDMAWVPPQVEAGCLERRFAR